MLHLKCFVWDKGTSGERGALGNGDRCVVGNEGQGCGGRNSIPFYSDAGGGRVWEEERRPDASRVPDVRALDSRFKNHNS